MLALVDRGVQRLISRCSTAEQDLSDQDLSDRRDAGTRSARCCS